MSVNSDIPANCARIELQGSTTDSQVFSGVFRPAEPLRLELGGVIERPEIAYHTFGRLNERRDNVIWVCHALTANSDVTDWWPHTVVPGGFLDPAENFVVCANILGSCYGTTGPLSINPATGEPYYGDFPAVTMRDVVMAHRLLADHLGLSRIHGLVGASVGGFQAAEWAAMEPERFDALVLLATAAKASPWAIAIDETQRMAIRADRTFGQRRPDAGAAGLAAARALGLLTYRGPEGYNLTQQDHPDAVCSLPGLPASHRACTYQAHQGEKLVNRFNAYSYVTILDTFDTHDIGRDRGSVEAALRGIAAGGPKILVIGLSTDLVFTPAEMRELAARIPGSLYREITSPLGHDGFLVEHGQLNSILVPFFEEK